MGTLLVVLTLGLVSLGTDQRGKPTVEKLSDGVYRIGAIQVDTKKREVVVTGKTNDATTLEWVANTQNGAKAYESAITLDTDGVTLNTALLLIGLDVKHARVPEFHFDPKPPQGDPVDLFVAWGDGASAKRVGIEQLLFDQRTNAPLPAGGWVYTGSMMLEGNQYRADADGGVLIGFVHSPAPVIENRNPGAVGAFGSVIFNKNLGLAPGTPVTLTIIAKSKSAATSGS
jgi:hypothetical protein